TKVTHWTALGLLLGTVSRSPGSSWKACSVLFEPSWVLPLSCAAVRASAMADSTKTGSAGACRRRVALVLPPLEPADELLDAEAELGEVERALRRAVAADAGAVDD